MVRFVERKVDFASVSSDISSSLGHSRCHHRLAWDTRDVTMKKMAIMWIELVETVKQNDPDFTKCSFMSFKNIASKISYYTKCISYPINAKQRDVILDSYEKLLTTPSALSPSTPTTGMSSTTVRTNPTRVGVPSCSGSRPTLDEESEDELFHHRICKQYRAVSTKGRTTNRLHTNRKATIHTI
ncbi:hypothetical protein M8J76_002250 [Diaphorina citri]|nr:hypothetical protein M8J76_002250 [Diaphorina citri]